MRTTITTEMDLGDGIRIEVDGDYWRGEDEDVTDRLPLDVRQNRFAALPRL